MLVIEICACYSYGPAHTGEILLVYFEKPILLSKGDLVFIEAYFRISIQGAGANIQNWIKVLRIAADESSLLDAIYILAWKC